MYEIAGNIFWNGVKHWTLRNFHGRELSTHRGSTYNSYIIKDEKTVLVDTVWYPFAESFVKRIAADPGLQGIDAVVINHVEPDHGGSLGRLFDAGLRPGIPVYCSKAGVDIINKYYHGNGWNLQAVGDGDSVRIGRYELAFFDLKMIHWPDSMMTYVKGAGVLLSNDAFGQHYCTSGFFNDEAETPALFEEAEKYFACILAPYTRLIERRLGEFLSLGLQVDMIAPSHGVIWRDNPAQIVGKYLEWSKSYSDGSVVIAYDCLYEATASIAEAIARGLFNRGVKHKIVNVGDSDVSDLIADLFRASGMIIGSSTINNSMHRSVAGLLDDVRGHQLKGKLGAAFGSYGWSGEAPKHIAEHLKQTGLRMFGEPIRIKYAPTGAELAECTAFGEQFADALKSN